MRIFTFNDIALKRHYKSIGYSFKLILIIIALKPIINVLEDTSFINLPISILQIIGLVLFVLLIVGLKKIDTSKYEMIFFIYKMFIILYVINVLLVTFNNFDFSIIAMSAKVLLAPLMFIYFLKNLRTHSDMNLILNSFLISSIPLLSTSIFSIIIGESISTRGFERISTAYGDIATIGISLNIVLVLLLYRFLSSKISLFILLGYIFVSILVLVNIVHAASTIIFFSIIILFLYYQYKERFFIGIVVSGILIIGSYFTLQDWSYRFINSFFGKELEMISSQESQYRFNDDVMFHGRMGRFKRHFDYYLEQNTFNLFLGGLSIKYPYMMGHGTHNDFLRILFTTGIVGFMLYVSFLLLMLFKSIIISNVYNKFLLQSALLILILYSITLTPSTYVDLNLFLMPTFIYVIKSE